MAAELGTTHDPKALVPGDVSAIVSTMWAMRDYATSLADAGAGLARIDTTEGWTGKAGDTFRDTYDGQPTKWTEAADCFRSAADALDGYASGLQWAQGEAADAIDLWDRGQEQTRVARAAYDADVARARKEAADIAHHGGHPHLTILPFEDPGEATRQAAREKLSHARQELQREGDAAEQVVGAARDKAPEKPGLLDKIGGAISDGLHKVGHALEQTGADVVNAFASVGNAMLHHPEDVAELLGGAALITLGSGGEVLGVGLDITGIGAVVGVPANAVSAAAIASGAGMMAMGAGDVAKHAGEDPVEAVSVEEEEPSGYTGKSGTKTDRLKEHLTDRDLDAARREANGEVVARKPNGEPWDHVNEVREAQQGLLNQIQRLQRKLGDPRLSEADRAAAQAELSEASKLLEHSKRYLPMR